MGHMTAPLPAFTAELSRLLVMLNQNPMKMESSRLLSFLEREVLAKLHRLVYREDDAFYAAQMHAKDAALGVMTSGGTIANVTALWLARNRACGDNLFALAEQGYRGAVILGSRLMHYSFDKGMDLLGLGVAASGVSTQTSTTGSVWRRWNRPFNNAGSRSSRCWRWSAWLAARDFGSVDPLPELAAIARREQIHFHVDAAWGGPTLFSPRYQGLLTGIEHADTVTLDGHKQLLVPLGTGMLLCRQPDLMMTVKREAPTPSAPPPSIRGVSLWRGPVPPTRSIWMPPSRCWGSRVMPNSSTPTTTGRGEWPRSSTPARLRADVGTCHEPALLPVHSAPPARSGTRWRRPTNRSISSTSPCKSPARRRAQLRLTHPARSLPLWRATAHAAARRPAQPLIEEADIHALLDDQVRLGNQIASQLFE